MGSEEFRVVTYPVPLQGRQVRFSHIFREGQKTVNFRAGRGAKTSTLSIFNSITADRYLLSLVRMNELGYPNFHFRYN